LNNHQLITMLEYFAYKKYKKYQAEKVLSQKDEAYFTNLADKEPNEIPLDKKVVEEGRPDGKYDWKLPAFLSKFDGKKAEAKPEDATVGPDGTELSPEDRELHDALERLNLASKGGEAFSLSSETKSLLDKFTHILKDTVNGVPTAYDDLVKFLDSSSPQIEKKYDSAPGFLQKLITTLPWMLLPEELIRTEGVGTATQKKSLKVPTLRQLIEKPTMITAALKTVMNALKTRFPSAAMSANTLMSMSLFVILFIFWYCHKRGREIRLEKEAAEAEAAANAAMAKAPTVPVGEPGASTYTVGRGGTAKPATPVPEAPIPVDPTAPKVSKGAPAPATPGLPAH